MVCYKTCISVITILTNECIVLLLCKYSFKVCVVSFGFDKIVCKFISICAAITHSDKQQHHFFVIAIVPGDFTMLMLQKYSFKVCVVLFGFSSTRYKVYIHIPCINTHQLTILPFKIMHVILSSDLQTPRLYQGSADGFEKNRNSGIFL